MNRFKTFYKKILSVFRIRRIRRSTYFDEDFYLASNPDVKNAKTDPASHFYFFGWKEYRKPNMNFDIEQFFERFPKAKGIDINPISYIIQNGIEEETRNLSKIGDLKASDLLEALFSISKPLRVLKIDSKDKRMNIVFNGFDKGGFFGGKATALILVTKFCKKYDYKLRIISNDPDKTIFYQFLEIFNISFNKEIEFYDTLSGKYLELGKGDVFLGTMWNNADSLLRTRLLQCKIFYLMQEVETFFYDHGDYHLRCYNTLSNDRIIPIVNTKLLYDYFAGHGYDNVKKGIYFEPAFSPKLLSPSETSFKKKDKYKLFFYARPGHQRNLFYFGLNVLNEAFLRGILDYKEWEVYLAGDDTIPNFDFDVGVQTHNLERMGWKEYYKFISEIDLLYSTIYTPHPSYPPFDFVRSGAVVLTNKFANKSDLSQYSKNIISAKLKEEDMLEKMIEAEKLVKNIQERKQNYLNSNIIETWDESFRDVLPFMLDKIEN